MKKRIGVIAVLLAALLLSILLLPASATELGDVDNSGVINAGDARLILRYSARLDRFEEWQLKRADVTGDGVINAGDARLVLRVSARIDSFPAGDQPTDPPVNPTADPTAYYGEITLSDIPEYDGDAYYIIGDGTSTFDDDVLDNTAFEYYSPLDELGRCGHAIACLGVELMPTEPRESISSVYPTGWKQNAYSFVNGGYLYNRCHLIGFQLAGENANELNLITGTRYLNTEGMLPFENMVADYIKETQNHVYYCVLPMFDDDDLLASGVTIDAYSLEDEGDGINFYIYCYNVQPGVSIDYSTGANFASGSPEATTNKQSEMTYVLNTKTMKFHLPTCSGVASMSEKNRTEYTGSRDEVMAKGYTPCGICKP